MGDKGSGCEHGLLLSFDRYKLLSISYLHTLRKKNEGKERLDGQGTEKNML
jgi:hypothetical protein